MTRAENLATLAWALAASGTGIDQIEDLICGGGEVGIATAGNRLRASPPEHVAYEALADLERSREHLSLSSQRDSQGMSGRVARETLASSTR